MHIAVDRAVHEHLLPSVRALQQIIADEAERWSAPATQCEAREYCVEGVDLERERIDEYVDRSLMLLTAPSPVIGRDKASAIAHKANDEGTTLSAAALASGHVSAEESDRTPSRQIGRAHV